MISCTLYLFIFLFSLFFILILQTWNPKYKYNKRLNKTKSHATSNIRYQCHFLIQILVDLNKSVNNNSISYEHVMALHNLLYIAKSDCKLLSQGSSRNIWSSRTGWNLQRKMIKAPSQTYSDWLEKASLIQQVHFHNKEVIFM